MEAKEFKEKFKVADKIICPFWIEVNYGHNTITYIGDEGFVSIDCENRECYSYFIDEDWQHYKEEKPKNLEGVFPYLKVGKEVDGRIWIELTYGNQRQFEEDKIAYDKDVIITLKEAKERGLKVSLKK